MRRQVCYAIKNNRRLRKCLTVRKACPNSVMLRSEGKRHLSGSCRFHNNHGSSHTTEAQHFTPSGRVRLLRRLSTDHSGMKTPPPAGDEPT